MRILQVLGTPTREQIREMNPNYTEFKFPQIKSHPWGKVIFNLNKTDSVKNLSRVDNFKFFSFVHNLFALMWVPTSFYHLISVAEPRLAKISCS